MNQTTWVSKQAIGLPGEPKRVDGEKAVKWPLSPLKWTHFSFVTWPTELEFYLLVVAHLGQERTATAAVATVGFGLPSEDKLR